MNVHRGLSTAAIVGALTALSTIGISPDSIGQQPDQPPAMAVPSGEFHRFSVSTLRVDPETSTTEAPATGIQAVTPEPISRGTFREAPTGFDNRTNGFDPQGPAANTINEDTVVPLRSFNDNKFIFEEVEGIADGLGPTYNAQSCRECHQNIVTGGAS
ncbi:MAG TPA: hypothetical protein VK624_02970, partial [Steroidobacteraceae bacterium]|nr:hypothetical protein [Steroidobacteraceae bacterium]